LTGSQTAAQVDPQPPALPPADGASESPPVPAAPAQPGAGWDAARGDVQCPLCEYDLRGLVEPRCPECGYAFTWPDVTDPARRLHPYLFEHHPERNAWSFVQTLLGGLFPTEFWSTLYPTQPSRPGRLIAYWVLCTIPLFVLAMLHVWLIVTGTLWQSRLSGFANVDLARLMHWSADYDVRAGALGILSVLCLVWSWATVAALLVFQASMRRARVRSTHVLRCVLYSADVSLWLAAPVGVAMLLTWGPGGWPPRNPLDALSGFVATGLWMLLTFRLFKAYQLYLRFDHALVTILASQVILGLAYWKLWLLAQGY